MKANGQFHEKKQKGLEISSLPKNWELVEFGSLISTDPQNGLYKPSSEYGSGTLILRIDDFENGGQIVTTARNRLLATESEIQTYSLRTNDIVVNRVNSLSHLGKTALIGSLPETLLFESNMMRFQVNENAINPRFVYLFLNSFSCKQQVLARAKRAVAQSSINQGDVKSLRIPVPKINEQKKIAYVLSTVQSAIAQQEQLIQTTTELKKALMNKLFTEGLHGEKQKETEIGPVPESWEMREIGSLETNVQSGQTPLRNKKEYYGGDIKWVKTLDLNGDVVIKTEECLTDEGFSALGRKLRPVDTVMVAMYGGAGTIGKSGILGIEAATNQAVCCIEPNYKIFSPRYLLHYFIHFRPHWMRFAIGTRKDPNISKTTIINTQIPLPTLEEQNEIVKVLDTLTWKISHAETKKALLNDLFQTLLHQLMTAQIRVHDIDLPGFEESILAASSPLA